MQNFNANLMQLVSDRYGYYTYLMILNDVTARRFNVLYGLIINFPNLPSGRK